MPRKRGGEGGSDAQKRGPAPSPPDAVGVNKKTSTPITSDRSTKRKTTNLNLAQGTKVDDLRTVTSYFDLHDIGPNVQEVQLLANTQVR